MDERLMKKCIGLSVPEWDMAHRLPINRLVGPDMWDSGTIFRFNSAYMDVTDQSFMEKQWMMGAALIAGGMPTLAVLIGILINRYDIGRLDRRLDSLESSFGTRLSAIEKDLKEFYAIQRVHDNRIDTLEGKK